MYIPLPLFKKARDEGSDKEMALLEFCNSYRPIASPVGIKGARG